MVVLLRSALNCSISQVYQYRQALDLNLLNHVFARSVLRCVALRYCLDSPSYSSEKQALVEPQPSEILAFCYIPTKAFAERESREIFNDNS